MYNKTFIHNHSYIYPTNKISTTVNFNKKKKKKKKKEVDKNLFLFKTINLSCKEVNIKIKMLMLITNIFFLLYRKNQVVNIISSFFFFFVLSRNLIFIQKNKFKQNIFEKKVDNKFIINSSCVYILPMKLFIYLFIHGISYTSTYTTTHFNILCFGFLFPFYPIILDHVDNI